MRGAKRGEDRLPHPPRGAEPAGREERVWLREEIAAGGEGLWWRAAERHPERPAVRPCCSFCGAEAGVGRRLIEAQDRSARICDRCLRECCELIAALAPGGAENG